MVDEKHVPLQDKLKSKAMIKSAVIFEGINSANVRNHLVNKTLYSSVDKNFLVNAILHHQKDQFNAIVETLIDTTTDSSRINTITANYSYILRQWSAILRSYHEWMGYTLADK